MNWLLRVSVNVDGIYLPYNKQNITFSWHYFCALERIESRSQLHHLLQGKSLASFSRCVAQSL